MRSLICLTGCTVTVLLLLCPGTVAAQTATVNTARSVATSFLDAATRDDWAAVVQLTERTSLQSYAKELRKTYREWAEQMSGFELTVESIMQNDSTMPRAVAEDTVRKAKENVASQPRQFLLRMLADVERSEQIDSLSDDALYIRRLRATQLKYIMSVGSPQGKGAVKPAPAENPTRTVKGVASISTDEAVALYLEDGLMTNLAPPDIGFHQLLLRRTSNGWRIVASDAVLMRGIIVAWGGVSSTDECPKPTPP